MKNLLAIEASGADCIVALSYKSTVRSLRSDAPRAHTASIFSFIDELLADADITVKQLDGIVFSAGPGSFTGIRLAASVAKSLAYAAQIPVVGISSLAAMANSFYQQGGTGSCLVLSDARMQEYYCAEYQYDPISGVNALQIDNLYTPLQLQELAHQSLQVVSDGSDFAALAFKDLSHHTVAASAESLLQLANWQWGIKQPTAESALTEQVNYLRDKSGWKNLEQQQRNPTVGDK